MMQRFAMLLLLGSATASSLAAQVVSDSVGHVYVDGEPVAPRIFEAHAQFIGVEPEGMIVAALDVGIQMATMEFARDSISSIYVDIPANDADSDTAQRIFQALSFRWSKITRTRISDPSEEGGSARLHVALHAYDLLPGNRLMVEGTYGCDLMLCAVTWRALFVASPLHPTGWSLIESHVTGRS